MCRSMALLMSLVFSSIAFAGHEFGPQTIRTIGTGWSGSGLYIWTNENNKLDECANPVYLIEPGHPSEDKLLAIALSAMHSKSAVNLYVEGCSGHNMRLRAIKVNG